MAKASTRLFWIKIHRWLGLAALAFLFIAGMTGSVLCFDKRIDAALNADLFYRQTSGTALSPPIVAASLQAQHPELVVTGFPSMVAVEKTMVGAAITGDAMASEETPAIRMRSEVGFIFLSPSELEADAGRAGDARVIVQCDVAEIAGEGDARPQRQRLCQANADAE